MSTYTDLHTRVIKENIAILRKPSQEDDGLTLQRVVFANKDNIYYGTFKGPLDLSGGSIVGTTMYSGKLEGTDVSTGSVKYDGGDINVSEIANNQLADEATMSSMQEYLEAISAAHDELSAELSTAISALDDNVNGRIDNISADLCRVSSDLVEVSAKAGSISGVIDAMSAAFIDVIADAKADAIVSSNAYTDSYIDELSGAVDNRLMQLSGTLSTYTNDCIEDLSTTIDNRLVQLSGTLSTYADEHINDLSNTVDNRLIQLSGTLSTYTNEQRNLLSDEVNASYVHKVGDEIAWLAVNGMLCANKALQVTDDDTKLLISDDIVSLATKAPVDVRTGNTIILSAFGDINASGNDFIGTFKHNISLSTERGIDSVNVNGKSVQSTLNDLSNSLDAKKLDIATAAALSNQICADVVSSGYLKALSVNLGYNSHDRLITLSAGDKTYSISADDFIKDGMLSSAEYDQYGDDQHTNPPYIKLVFNADASKEPIWISVKDLVNIYEASNDGILLSGNVFCLKYDDIKDKTGLVSLCSDLFGTGMNPGMIPEMSSNINAISVDNFQVMSFAGHFIVNDSYYDNLCAFFATVHGSDLVPRGLVKNDSAFNIVTEDTSCIVINGLCTLSIGNGDVLVVHDHSNTRFVELSDLVYDKNYTNGNVYLLKAGVSRYEFEDENSQHTSNEDFISAWIKRNFANTDGNDKALTTTMKLDVSVDNDLSVAKNAYVLRSFNAANSTLVVSEGNVKINDVVEVNSEQITATKLSAAALSASDVLIAGSLDANDVSASAISAASLDCYKYDNGLCSLQDFVNSLDTLSSESGNEEDGFVQYVTEADGKVSVIKKSIEISDIAGLSDYYTKSQTSSANEICIAFESADSIYFRKSGGTISGDTVVSAASLSVIRGNYVQTSTPDGIYNYSTNAFIQAESTKYGLASAGSKGFYVIGIDAAAHAIQLSIEEGCQLSDYIPSSTLTCAWSLALGSYLDSQFSTISCLSGNAIVFNNALGTAGTIYNGKPLSTFTEFIKNNDDNAMYCPLHPEAGNAIITRFSSNHVEGGSTHAIAQFAHAEGRLTFAEGRYSHAEGGNNTTAGGAAAHAEGAGTKALGNNSHSEGNATSALANYSHAEGYKSVATGQISHAEGNQTHANGNSAHAEGYCTYAIGNYSHAEGQSSVASAECSHAAGYGATADSNCQWVWNGISSSTYSIQGKVGSFCINPKNGISGFYISKRSLADYLGNVTSAISEQISSLDVSNTLSVGQILTSLQQDDGKMSYGAKVLEISDVSSLQELTAQLTADDQYLSSQISVKQDALTEGQLSAISCVSSLADNLLSVEAKMTTVMLSSAAASMPLTGGKLDQLNIIKFDNYSTYELCTTADPDLVGLSDLVLIDEKQLNAKMSAVISVADPINQNDAANKHYVDSAISGKLSALLDDTSISQFCNAVDENGLENVALNISLSAVYSLITILRNAAQ